jgi:hypothetical protein
MPEPTPVPTPPAVPAAATPPVVEPVGATPPVVPAEEPLGAPGLRALQAERDRAAAAETALAAANAKVAQFEQANQTDLEREKARADAAETALATERTQRMRLQAATDHGIPAAHLILLTATDEAGLKAQAEQVAALVGAQPPAVIPPAPLPGQGTPPAAPATGSVSAGAELYRQRHQKT